MPESATTVTAIAPDELAVAALEQTATNDAWFGAITPSTLAPPIPEPLRALLEAGGPVMLILAAASVFALTVVLLKLWQFSMLRGRGEAQIETALVDWRAGRGTAALAGLASARHPSAAIVRTAMLGLRRHNDPAALREEVERQATGFLASLRSHLRSLEVIASLSPLLGLLGTVIGMIDAFRALEAAGNQVDPAVLSGGIWVALLTTAAGLSVAIPTLVALNGFERQLEGITARLEDQVTRVFTADLKLSEPHPREVPDSLHAGQLDAV